MTLYRCCPVDCYTSCCEFMASCDPGVPTSILCEVEVYCTRKFFVDGTLHTTIVLADYQYSYEATNFSTQTITLACGTVNYYKSSTVRYRLDGDVANGVGPVNETPTNAGTGGCFGSSCLGPILPCQDWCGPGCLTCLDTDWEWCVDYNQYTKDVIVPDFEAELACCYDQGCYKLCIDFKCVAAFTCTETGGTWSQTSNCCGFVPITPQSFPTNHNDFKIAGACGCLGSSTFKNLKVYNFDWGGFVGSGDFVGQSPQTVCTDITGVIPTVFERGCGCEDYTTSPPTVNYVQCQESKIYWQDCCTYTVNVTVT